MTSPSEPAASLRRAPPPLLAAAALACGLALVVTVLAQVHPGLLPLEARRFAYRHALLLDVVAMLAVLGLVLILHRVQRRGPAAARAWKRAVAAGVAVVVVAFALRLIETWAVVPPRTADACAEQGGMWAAGPDGVFRCNPRATDAGRACLDSSECQGRCLALPQAAGAEPLGQCSGYVRADGCPEVLRHGQVVGGCG